MTRARIEAVLVQALLLCVVAACSGQAHQEGGIALSAAWLRASAPGAAQAAAYFTITNTGSSDRLIGVESTVGSATLHESRVDAAGVVRMQPLETVDLPAGQVVEFAPLGRHVMLTGLRAPLRAGQRIPLVLKFAHAPPVSAEAEVRAVDAQAPVATRPTEGMEHQHH